MLSSRLANKTRSLLSVAWATARASSEPSEFHLRFQRNLLAQASRNGSIIPPISDPATRPWSATQQRGVKVNASHLKPGNIVEKSGRIYQVLGCEHKQHGRGGASLQLEVRDIDNGSKQSLRFGTEEAVEKVHAEEKTLRCLYTEHKTAYLMDPENFEQHEFPLKLFGTGASYLKEEMEVKLQLYDGRALSGSIPRKVTCSIKDTYPYIKGQSATPRYKKALLDNDIIVHVPAYLEIGEKIIVNTDENSFVNR